MCNFICTVELCPSCGNIKTIVEKGILCESNFPSVTGEGVSRCEAYREHLNTIVSDSQCIRYHREDLEEEMTPSRDSKSDSIEIVQDSNAKSMQAQWMAEGISEDDCDPNDDQNSAVSDVSSLSDDHDASMMAELLTGEVQDNDDISDVDDCFERDSNEENGPDHETRAQ
ncbi:hypothetical protein DSL72_008013 [Monilinia vaccinii-corymbosi]|uniref:Uncharacterized protein n=1 Tax=Monilinia vaccinii-corymbosi TaxID=61207 RepID=A0A8A3PIQ2_9HELO|nr:hypothetical protein DSL72_008013 [Monilinia vaccinii-corymbosi]